MCELTLRATAAVFLRRSAPHSSLPRCPARNPSLPQHRYPHSPPTPTPMSLLGIQHESLPLHQRLAHYIGQQRRSFLQFCPRHLRRRRSPGPWRRHCGSKQGASSGTNVLAGECVAGPRPARDSQCCQAESLGKPAAGKKNVNGKDNLWQ